jgi:hypothetical protein
MIATILVGVAVLTEATPVPSHIRHNLGVTDPPDQLAPPEPWTGPTPVVLRPGVGMGTAGIYRRGLSQPMHRPPQNRSPSDRFLVLTGVIAYTDPKQGFAIIGNSVDNTFLVKPGQQLPDGAWIREIHPKHILLEHGGNFETVGMYRRDEGSGTVYAEMYPMPVQAPPLPQQARWEEPENAAGTAEMKASQARPAAVLPGFPDPSETRRTETPATEARSNDAQASDTPLSEASSKPETPVPAAQDPADELGDDRRQHAENRRK